VTRRTPDGSQDGTNTNTSFIIGLAVGISVLVLIIIIIIVVCAARLRRKRSMIENESNVNYNNLRAEERHQYDDVATTVGHGTTRSFMFGSEHLHDKPVESVNVSQY